MRLQDRVAMITGAGSVMRKGIAMRMAQEGADIIAIDINEDGIKDTALDLAKKNINVNAICPGPIDTPLLHNLPEKNRQEMLQVVPKGRVGTPLAIANLTLFLASDEEDYITGQAINCDGGWMMTA